MKCPIELASEYKIFEQFGKPIGPYQSALTFAAKMDMVILTDPGITMAFAYGGHIHEKDFCSYGLTYSNYDISDTRGRGELAHTCVMDSPRVSGGAYIGGNDNIGHWFYNCLSKLAIVNKMDLKEPLLVRRDMTGVREDMLTSLLEKGQDVKLVDHNMSMRDGWLLSTPAYRGGWTGASVHVWPEAYWWVRHKLQTEKEAPRRIYVSRANCKWRRVLNEEEVADFLRPLGFEVIDWSGLPWDDQRRIMSNCSHLVTPVAASSPISGILGPAGMKILELSRAQMAGTFGSKLWADLFAQHYQRLDCADLPCPGDTLNTANNNDLLVNMDRFKKAVEKML